MLSLQSLGSAQKGSWSRDSSSSPLSHIEEDHVYRFVLRARTHTLDVAVCNAASPCLSPWQLPKQTEVVRLVHGHHDLGARQQPVGARPSSSGAQRRAAEFSFLRHQWYVHAAPSLTSCLSCPHSAVRRVSTEEAAPPLPSCSFSHYENGGGPDITVSPPPQEKPRRNGTRPDETRPTVESLLDELEGSVPSPRYGGYLRVGTNTLLQG